MDQAPRQTIQSRAVLVHERTAVMDVEDVVKTLASSGEVCQAYG